MHLVELIFFSLHLLPFLDLPNYHQAPQRLQNSDFSTKMPNFVGAVNNFGSSANMITEVQSAIIKIYISIIFLATLKKNKRQRVYAVKNNDLHL